MRNARATVGSGTGQWHPRSDEDHGDWPLCQSGGSRRGRAVARRPSGWRSPHSGASSRTRGQRAEVHLPAHAGVRGSRPAERRHGRSVRQYEPARYTAQGHAWFTAWVGTGDDAARSMVVVERVHRVSPDGPVSGDCRPRNGFLRLSGATPVAGPRFLRRAEQHDLALGG